MKYPEPETVYIVMPEGGDIPFDTAKALAVAEAKSRTSSAMLLSWKDNTTGAYSPVVEACGDCGLEGWELYAASRGAQLRIEVNGGDYVFLFRVE